MQLLAYGVEFSGNGVAEAERGGEGKAFSHACGDVVFSFKVVRKSWEDERTDRLGDLASRIQSHWRLEARVGRVESGPVCSLVGGDWHGMSLEVLEGEADVEN